MNVTLNKIDSANATIAVKVEKADYQERVEKALRTYRQKANIPGFRKGMAPVGMIKKMFGKSLLAEEINKLVGEGLFGYIRENNVNILGEPLPNETEQKQLDFDTQEDFEFIFDLGLAPEVNITLSKEDKVDYYQIEITNEMVQKQAEAFAERTGKYEQVEVAEGKDMIKGQLAELDEAGNVKEGGIQAEASVMIPFYFKNDDEKAKFEGAKLNSTVVFNPNTACAGNEFEMAHILKVEKEAAKEITSNFSFTIEEITRHVPAALDQELFDQIFGKDNVKSVEEFNAKVKEMLVAQVKPECDYKFLLDLRPVLEAKAGELAFPEAFLKRFLQHNNENKTAESIDAEYPEMVKELTWHLIKEKLAKDYSVKVEEADLLEVAKAATRAQFAGYGMMDVPADILENYAKNMIKDDKSRHGLIERAIEDKIRDAAKEQVSLNEKAISQEDFYKLFEGQN